MRSAVNERWKPFTSVSSPGKARSWLCSDVIAYQPARRSRVFSPRWIRVQSSPCAPCFLTICWLVLWEQRSNPAGWSPGKGTTTSSSIWMAPARLLANEPYRGQRIGPLRNVVCASCVPPPTRGASVGKSCARATVLQAHTHQWLATFGNPGNGEYRAELRRAVTVIQCYRETHHHPEERVLLRLDGQYGTGAVLTDLAGLPFVMRGKEYHLLKRAEIQTSLDLPADQHLTHP